MILSTDSLQELLDKQVIKIEPKAIVKDATILMHLSSRFAKKDKEFVDYKEYTLKPKEFALALTKERIIIPKNYAALYDGYTHLARKGVLTHGGSMFVHPEVDCQITLEIFNASDEEVVLTEGQRVGHLVILQVKLADLM